MSENCYSVYVHTCMAAGRSYGKKYVGQTMRNPEERWGSHGQNYKHCVAFHNAITKYGWDAFSHEVIASGLTQQEADTLEIMLILAYDSANPKKGYNLTIGGRSLRGAENPASRPVAVYKAETGQLIEVFATTYSAKNFVGAEVWNCLNGRAKTCNGFICRYADGDDIPLTLPENERKRPRAQPLKEKPVCQYSLQGEYIATFSSIQDAETQLGTGKGCIGNAVRGKSLSAGGYMWRYASEGLTSLPSKRSPYQTKVLKGNAPKSKPIEMVDVETNQVVAIFSSSREAERQTGISRSTICAVVKKQRGKKSAGGYFWRYSA